MMLRRSLVTAVLGTVTLVALAASSGADPLTGLPRPGPGDKFQLDADPMKIDNGMVCKSKSVMDYFSGSTGTVNDALAWYGAHLSGFKHEHAYAQGRSQDVFYNAQGTQMVSVTGSPGADNQNTRVYAVIYGTFTPGASPAVIQGMNVQKVVCK